MLLIKKRKDLACSCRHKFSLWSRNVSLSCYKCFVECYVDSPFCFPSLFHRYHLDSYTSDYTAQVLVGYCAVYIFMQTFMIPGTVFMSLLAGSLFGVFKGVALVVFAATAGASSCFFFSKLIGRPLLFSLWPDKLEFFQAQVNITLLVAIFGFNNHQIWINYPNVLTSRWLKEGSGCWTTCFF